MIMDDDGMPSEDEETEKPAEKTDDDGMGDE